MYIQPVTYVIDTTTGEQVPVFQSSYPRAGSGGFVISGTDIRVRDDATMNSGELTVTRGMKCYIAVKFGSEGPVAVRMYYPHALKV